MVLGGSGEAETVLIDHEYMNKVGVSYVTPISLITERIKLFTGKDVELIAVDFDGLDNVDRLMKQAS